MLDVRAAGLCHSDVGFMDRTLTAMLRNVRMTLGQRVAGVVAQLGEGVSGPADFAPGWSVDGAYASQSLKRGGVVGRLVTADPS